jgi:hypothetical protein
LSHPLNLKTPAAHPLVFCALKPKVLTGAMDDVMLIQRQSA